MRPHRRQPTRLPRPWDSPGKNTGMGCHFLLQCMKVKSEREVAQSCPTLNYPMDWSLPGSSVHGIFQARVLEWGAIAFSVQHIYRRTYLHYCFCFCLVAQSCPTLLQPHGLGFSRQEYWRELPSPFSRGSFWPRVQIHISCQHLLRYRQILYHWAIGEAHYWTDLRQILTLAFTSCDL